MTRQSASRFLDVTAPQAITLLMRARTRRVLTAFLGRENSVSGAAVETGLDIKTVHRDVLALHGAGLLTLVQLRARAGRSVKLYQAAADAFFVNHLNTSATDLAEWHGQAAEHMDTLFHQAAAREFNRALRESGREWGLRLYATPEAPGYRVDEGDRAGKLTDPLQEWAGPQANMLSGMPVVELTTAQAQEIQLEFIQLMREARQLSEESAGQRRQPFLLRVGLAPLTKEEAQGLFRS